MIIMPTVYYCSKEYPVVMVAKKLVGRLEIWSQRSMSLVERLSSFQRSEMCRCFVKRTQRSVPCREAVLFSEVGNVSMLCETDPEECPL